jgi:hypothetical protein
MSREVMRMKMSLRYTSNVDASRPDVVHQIRERVFRCLSEVDPQCGEFVIELGGESHGATYMVVGGVVEVIVTPLDEMNALLHRNDLPGICED